LYVNCSRPYCTWMRWRKSWILHHRLTHIMQVQLKEVLFVNNIIYTDEIKVSCHFEWCTNVWNMMPCNLIERCRDVGRRFKSCAIYFHTLLCSAQVFKGPSCLWVAGLPGIVDEGYIVVPIAARVWSSTKLSPDRHEGEKVLEDSKSWFLDLDLNTHSWDATSLNV